VDLQGLFSKLTLRRDPNLLVGIETNDDAAIYRLSEDSALVVTADFITPPVDDPYLFGQIAAANSISDVYAMGGKPLTVLNLCMFPVKAGADVLGEILRGGLDKTHESGAILVGGHTIKDEEMKYGLSVNGLVNPKHYTPNSGARPDDVFILTKPIGSGVYIWAQRNQKVTAEDMAVVGRSMATLNRVACETMMEFDARGATDITGFGLGGHSLGMAKASKLGIRFFYDAIPKFPNSLALIDAGGTTGLTGPNKKLLEGSLEFRGTFSPTEQTLIWDPQTSGGLFFGIRRKDVDACLKKLHERGVADARIVGEAFPAERAGLEVVRS
jgi:selenide,water dikinase